MDGKSHSVHNICLIEERPTKIYTFFYTQNSLTNDLLHHHYMPDQDIIEHILRTTPYAKGKSEKSQRILEISYLGLQKSQHI